MGGRQPRDGILARRPKDRRGCTQACQRRNMMKLSLRVFFICAALVLAAPQILSAQDPQKPLAVVEGQPIYEQDLMSVAGPSLLDLRKQEYKAKSDALDKVIRMKLVEAEAKKRGLTADELLKQEVDSKVADPSDDEAKGFYLAQRSQTTLPFDQVKPQVKQLLKASEIQQAREKYLDSLRDKADVSILLQPPSVQMGYDPARVRGDAKAPITIVEFSDFQCPFCKKVQGALNDVMARYPGRVKLAYRDFPMRTLHTNAQIAAEAGRCAGEQGKFWEFHDAMYADQSKLDQPGLLETAHSLGMDGESFRSCLTGDKFKAQIEQDVQDGTRAGVSGTPGFFINGEFVNGAKPEADFEKVIESELAAIGRQNSAQASR